MNTLQKLSTILLIALMTSMSYAKEPNKILIVLTSHSELGNTGKKTGFWLPELTHPYYVLKKAGYSIDIASPQGGMAPLDVKAWQEDDHYHQVFLKDAELMAKVIRTIPLSSIKAKDYKAVLYSGGSGPMWDFPNNKDIQRISKEIYENQGIVSALCHGSVALVNIKLSNDKLLIEGKKVTGFSNKEEAMLGTTKIVPFLLEDKLKERGAIYHKAKPWQENIIISDRLITGQNPASATKLAEAIIKVLENK